MKPITTMLLSGLLAGTVAASANAMPRLDGPSLAPSAAPAVEPARLICNYHRCYRVGGYRHYYYRPYGYYRPYYYAPHVGIGLGGFGIGIY